MHNTNTWVSCLLSKSLKMGSGAYVVVVVEEVAVVVVVMVVVVVDFRR